MSLMITPEVTYLVLLVVEALHVLHHRLAKRHISFAEVASATALCVPPTAPVPDVVMMAAHLGLAAVQIVGSPWIRRLSPVWEQ
jgi:hypothetical protein